MSEFLGIDKSSSAILIKKIDETSDFKKFSNVAEVTYLPSNTGNGVFYMKIFTQGEAKDIVSGTWKVNPLMTCSYNWCDESAHIDITDVNGRSIRCYITIDWRTIFKRKGDLKEGIKNIFEFITSLQKYSDVAHIQRELNKFLNSPVRYSSI